MEAKHICIMLVAWLALLGFICWCDAVVNPGEKEIATETKQLIAEVDDLSAKLETLIEAKKNNLPNYVAYSPPPFQAAKTGIDWEADLRVKIQFLRWQIEFLVMLQNLEQKPPGRIGQVIGAVDEPQRNGRPRAAP